MPNGKPGDNPITDVVVHNQTVFGQEIDELMREVARLNKHALYRLPSHLFMPGGSLDLKDRLLALKRELNSDQ